MPLIKNTSRRKRVSQAAEGPSTSAGRVYNGPMTRSRARLMAAMYSASLNGNETQINTQQAAQHTASSEPLRAGREREPPTKVSEGMKKLAEKRLTTELKEISKKPIQNCTVKLIDDNIYKWEAIIMGPSKTPYEKGVFKLNLKFPISYPFHPPDVRFVTKIFHCNVSQEGLIYVNDLRSEWTPANCISKILTSIIQLLKVANPLDPCEANIGEKYIKNRKAYDALARQWTQLYAIVK